jgi:hypothetical protein
MSYTLKSESRRTSIDTSLRQARAAYIDMAPAATGSPSQADTPMTDANDDVIPSVPVDALTVRDSVFSIQPLLQLSHSLFGSLFDR